MAVLAEMAAIRMNEYVFPGQRGQLSHRMLQLALQRTGRADITVHGFRSAFRDWSGNETHAPREVCEQALGHATGDAVELAYRRSDALDKRRKLMTAWAGFCFPTSAEIRSLSANERLPGLTRTADALPDLTLLRSSRPDRTTPRLA